MTEPTRDEDSLARSLAEALQGADDVPERFWRAGHDAYAWLTIDAELAELTSTAAHPSLQARAEPFSPAPLTFATQTLTVQVEVTEASLEGQVVPPAAGSMEVRERSGRGRTVAVDDDGWFRVDPPPEGPFQLCYRSAEHTVVTEWTGG
jgi:hypothetical protein